MTLVWFSVALLIAAALDCASTLYAVQRMGGWHGEANPMFAVLGGNEAGTGLGTFLLLGIKAVTSILTILWLGKVMGQIPKLYPHSKEEYGFVRFANNVFYGKDVPWWTSLFGVPPFSRIYRFLSVPVATAIVVSGVAVSITNTFGLLNSLVAVGVFWIASGVIGLLLGIEFLRRDFLHISQNTFSQPSAPPNGGPAGPPSSSGVSGGPPSVS